MQRKLHLSAKGDESNRGRNTLQNEASRKRLVMGKINRCGGQRADCCRDGGSLAVTCGISNVSAYDHLRLKFKGLYFQDFP